jgi:hypothetical protein
MTSRQHAIRGPAAGSTTNWSVALEQLRSQADPEIDQLVADYHRRHPELGDVRSLVLSMIRELGEAKRSSTGYPTTMAGLSAELVSPPDLPPWGRDAARIRRGQAVFADKGLYQSVALFFASLPMAYAAVDGAEILARVSDLATANLTRRVAETGQMLIDVMGLRGPDALEPGGPGYATAIGLRLLHSCVRAIVLDQDSGPPWDTGRFGPPVNQELLLATLLDFTLVTWQAVQRMGLELDRDDREAHVYTWSVVGFLMGLQACQRQPLSLADVDELSTLMNRHLGSSEAGRRLMKALLDEMEGFMYLGWRKLPRSLVRWLFRDAPDGVDRVPDLLAVPKAAWWAGPLFDSLRETNRRAWLLGPLRPLARLVIRKAGRYVLLAFTDRYAMGPAPFRIPDELARRWRVRQGPAARRVRAARRRFRHTMRTGSLVPERSGRSQRGSPDDPVGAGNGGVR